MSRCVRLLSVALAVGPGMAISVPVTAGDSPAVAVGVPVPGTVAATGTVNVSEAAARQGPSRSHVEPSAQTVGPPTLDIGLSPDPNVIYVGSEQRALYAVEASF